MMTTPMLEINLESDKKFSSSSKNIKVTAGTKYTTTTNVTGIEGEPFCGYFGVIIFDKNNEEIERKIQWLNDFSGNQNVVSVIFNAPENADNLIIVYRINDEVPINAQCKYKILPTEEASFKEAESHMLENFNHPDNYTLPAANNLSEDQELSFEKNLVWVFASPRSGTTWLGTQLLSHETISINELQIGIHLGSREERVKDRRIRNIDLYKKDPDYFFSDKYKNTWKIFLRKLILNRIYAQVNDLSKKIIIKEPIGTAGADIISECLPNSRIIILVRDGRDVIDSLLDYRKEKSWASSRYGFTSITEKNRLTELNWEISRWLKLCGTLLKVFENHSEELRMIVKYEDLLKNTVNELEKIYKFINVNIPKNDLLKIVEKYSFEKIPKHEKGEGKAIRSAEPGKWKKSFNSEEKELLEKLMGYTQKKLGY